MPKELRYFFAHISFGMGSIKEEIMTVALHLFAKNGYEAVSVSQIARTFGMTKEALYRHYENKL